jgi:hypothetical protein
MATIKQTKINKKYTHFCVSKATNKIVDGWEYKGVDNESIQTYYKMDIKNNDRDRKEHRLLTGKHLLSKGINPFDATNWGNN